MTYEWDGMRKIDRSEALVVFNNCKPVFLLYDDNTEAEATCLDDIYKHDGEYGIEI